MTDLYNNSALPADADLTSELGATSRLHELITRLAGCQDLRTALEEVLDASIGLMGADTGNVLLLNPQKQVLEMAAHRGLGFGFLERFREVRSDDATVCGRAMSTGKRTVVEDVQADRGLGHQDVLIAENLRGMQATPLTSRDGRLLGMLSTHYRRPHRPAERELRVLDLYARQAADFIERIRGLESIAAAEERFRSLVSVITSVVWTTDPEGRFVAPQPAWSAYTGQSWEQMRDFGWVSALHPDDQAGVIRLWEKARRTRTLYESEGRLWHARTATWRHFRARGVAICNVDGSVREWVGKYLDIEEQKHAELELREREDRYRTLFTSIDEGFCLCEMVFDDAGQPRDYRFLEVNPHFSEMTGITPDAIGRTARDLVPGLEDWWVEKYGAVVLTGQPLRFEQGSEAMGRVFDVYATPVGPWQRGHFALVFKDITDRRRAEVALRESESRFRSFADGAPAMLWVTEPDGAASFLSKGWLDFTGQQEHEGLGFGWLDAVHADDREASRQRLLDAHARHDPFTIEVRVRRADGENRWVMAAGQPRFGGNNEFAGLIGSVIDIHDRKQNEEALRDADRRKDEFLATLAHELRNPLAPLRHGLHAMKLAAHDEAVMQSARAMMERQLTNMVRLVDDLLDLSRIAGDKIELRTERVDLASVIRNAVETSRPLLDEAGHVLAVAVPDEPLYVDADVTRLAQVFSNLLNNAAKFTPPRGRIELSASRDGGNARVTVRDNGVGIAPEVLPRIFDMFAQGERSLERAHDGLGIGLTLVRRLVEMHHGSVDVRSEGPGRGSEFTVCLPAVLAPVGRAADGVSAESGVPSRLRRRILIVDDNVDAALSLSMVLSLTGNETHVAHDGLEALAVAEAFAPEVVLLDIGMPKLSGYEVARRMRETAWGKEIVLIAMTGWGQQEDKWRSRQAGFNQHLTKPVDMAALEKLLGQVSAAV